MATETKTRTRKVESDKEQTQAAEKAKAEARAAEQAERKAAKEQEKAEAKEKREQELAAKREAKEEEARKERQDLIDAGELIEVVDGDGEVTKSFTVATAKKDVVAQRAAQVIEELKDEGTEIPMSGKYFADKYGGGTVQWVTLFGTLRMLNLVQAYRYKTGSRGESGLAYKWIGEDGASA